jgi:hypothetical protein
MEIEQKEEPGKSVPAILKELERLYLAKDNDYSCGDSLGNFSEATRIGVPAWKGAFVRLQDKYTRACNLISGRESQVKDESLEDTLMDLANYSAIVLCLLRRERH